jgi:two-component system, cell cycle sensor histidine kinase and response regulator CckA
MAAMEPTAQRHLLHDLMNLLVVVSGYVDAIRSRAPAEQPASSEFAELDYAIERAIGLARSVILGSAIPRAERSIDVDEFVQNMSMMLQRAVEPRVLLTLRVGGPAGTVRASSDELERILLNLTLNAAEATSDGGEVIVETSGADQGQDRPGALVLTPRRMVRISIRDSGCGVPAALQSRVTEPFYTTKSGGTGIGLDSVARTVWQLRGRLQIDSEAGLGTTVHVDLPLEPRG